MVTNITNQKLGKSGLNISPIGLGCMGEQMDGSNGLWYSLEAK